MNNTPLQTLQSLQTTVSGLIFTNTGSDAINSITEQFKDILSIYMNDVLVNPNQTVLANSIINALTTISAIPPQMP